MIEIMSEELGSLLQGLQGRECEFATGALVFHLDDQVRLVHFVRRGAIHLVRTQEDGAALILQRARAGSILAEASVYSDRYHCDARAESDSVTWAVAREDLCRRLDANPELALDWARHLAHEVQRARAVRGNPLAKDSRGAAQLLALLERRSPRERAVA